MKKLSIIIPCYNGEPYIHELLDLLKPQVTDDIEVVIVDDGSDTPLKCEFRTIRTDNFGLSHARNVGIDNTSGEYIAFIDADDRISENYVQEILARIPFDYLEMSWKSFGGMSCHCKLNSERDYLDNCSVWSRVYARNLIGKLRFNENKDATEDEDFTRRLGIRGANKYNRKIITDYVYFYRTNATGSLFDKYMRGECKTQRIVYYYPEITKSMDFLIDEIREEDKQNEVWVLTEKNELPELEKYAQVAKPFPIRGMELRGMPTSCYSQIRCPVKAQVVLWTNKTFEIGGIETFIYNFCVNMKDYYDITVLYNEMNIKQIERLKPYVPCVKNDTNLPVICDTLIVNRIIDGVPKNIKYKKIIQMVHTCKHIPTYHIPQGRDMSICVSEACRKSFGSEGDNSIVLHNIMDETPVKKSLLLVSATRLDTNEKGQRRMLKLASLMNVHKIPYVWLYFSNHKLENAPPNMVCMQPTLDIKSYIAMASYLVQLSDTEAFCFALVEALSLGIPVICTQLDVLPEIGFKEGENGYSVPFDIDDDFDVEKFYTRQLKGFKYNYDNKSIVSQWRKILGNTVPTHSYKPSIKKQVRVRVLIKYFDIVMQTQLYKGMELDMPEDRAIYLRDVKKFVEIL